MASAAERISQIEDERERLRSVCQGITDKAAKEGRVKLNKEETDQFDAAFRDMEDLAEQAKKEGKLIEMKRSRAERGYQSKDKGRTIGESGLDPADDEERGLLIEFDDGKRKHFKGSRAARKRVSEAARMRGTPEYARSFAFYISEGIHSEDARDLQADSAVGGGYLFASEKFADELIANITDEVMVRGLANQISLTEAKSIGFPTLESRMDAADWTAELQTGTKDTGLGFGKRALTPHWLAKKVLVSRDLLNFVGSAESFVRSELARVVAEANENAFLYGDGQQKPLGLFYNSVNGLDSTCDIVGENGDTEFHTDTLYDMKYSLKQAYWNGARWGFHREVFKEIVKLKDGEGRYIWTQGNIRNGEPDFLLGLPVSMSEWLPHTVAASAYVGILGNFKHYWIVDGADMGIVREDHLYIESNQVLFIIRMKTDGAPVRKEAFRRMKMAA